MKIEKAREELEELHAEYGRLRDIRADHGLLAENAKKQRAILEEFPELLLRNAARADDRGKI
jgi:hypothetical protein